MIGAVVVLYNPTKEEIQNINCYKNNVDYIVIIDNSDANNKEMVDKIVHLTSNTLYYSENTNLGLAKGFNIGVNLLINQGCEWVLLFDADSQIESDIITIYNSAIEKYKNNSVAVFSPVHVFDRSKRKPYPGYKSVNWSMTSGCLYNCEIFKKQQGFFEKLFVDGLDMDYCLRSHENGYEVIECGEAVLKHNPANTRCFLGIKYGIASPYRYFMQARQLIWSWRRYKNNEMICIYIYKWLKIIFLFPDKKEYVRNMINGTKEGCQLVREFRCKR